MPGDERGTSAGLEWCGVCVCQPFVRLFVQEDLCDMKVNKVVKPRPASATSIPGMLTGAEFESSVCNNCKGFMHECIPMHSNHFLPMLTVRHTAYRHWQIFHVIRTLLQSEWDALMSETYDLKTPLPQVLR